MILDLRRLGRVKVAFATRRESSPPQSLLCFLSTFMEKQMETDVRDTIVSTSGVSQDTAGTLNRPSSSARAAVDSIAGVAHEAARSAKPAIERILAAGLTTRWPARRVPPLQRPTGWPSEQ